MTIFLKRYHISESVTSSRLARTLTRFSTLWNSKLINDGMFYMMRLSTYCTSNKSNTGATLCRWMLRGRSWRLQFATPFLGMLWWQCSPCSSVSRKGTPRHTLQACTSSGLVFIGAVSLFNLYIHITIPYSAAVSLETCSRVPFYHSQWVCTYSLARTPRCTFRLVGIQQHLSLYFFHYTHFSY